MLGGSTVELTRVECRPALFLVLGQMYPQPTLPSFLFLGLLTRHRVGVALFGQARTIASDLRVAGSRYALGPYTPVDPMKGPLELKLTRFLFKYSRQLRELLQRSYSREGD